MAEDPGRETRIVAIRGRSVVVRKLHDAQFGLLVREANVVRRASAEQDAARVIRATDLLMRTLASAIVQEEDKEWLDDLMADGEIEMSDLLSVIRVFSEDQEEQPKPAVRRGRPAKRS